MEARAIGGDEHVPFGGLGELWPDSDVRGLETRAEAGMN